MAATLPRVIKAMYENTEAPPSFRTPHVILIPKAKDRARLVEVEAYRPVILTNTDYKAYTKVLVRRLQTVIKELVVPHRTCGIKGRSIISNIHTAMVILECCDEKEGRVAMIQIGIEKACDRVVLDVILLILEHVNAAVVITDGVRMA